MRRSEEPATAPPGYVLQFATLGAPERRRLATRRRRETQAEPEPEPTPVSTGRATVISVSVPFEERQAAARWLSRAGEPELEEDLRVLNRALHAFRLVTADPYLNPIRREQLLAARLGYGEGAEVADGRWTEARELRKTEGRQRRAKVLHPQARLAAVLGARERVLACEELALRAHLDLEHDRPREAALQVLVALDAAVSELSLDPQGDSLAERIAELRAQRDAVSDAAQAALAGELSEAQLEAVTFTLNRIEAALRARAVRNA